MGHCNCESAYCKQHGGAMEPYPKCDSCPNKASGRYVMLWVGPICVECYEVALANGGSDLVEDREWSDPLA